MPNPTVQAYHQAPWRVQLQWVLLFLLGLILVAFIAGIYLSVSARAATTGREIQNMEMDAEVIERDNADLESQLAFLTSAAQMNKRAKDMGFVPIEPGTEIYMKIPGYTGRQPAVMAPPPGPGTVTIPLIRPNYTQSLWEYLFQAFIESPLGKSTVQP